MACEADFDHVQGHDSNLEGPLRLSVPASLGSVGKCRESEDGRVCSRNRKCDMDYLYGKDIYKNGDRQEEIGLRCGRDIYAEEDIYGYKNDKDFVAAAIAAGGTKTNNRRFVMDAIDAERTNVGEKVPSMDGRYLWDINMADRCLIVPRGSNTGAEEGPPVFVNQVNGWNTSDDEEQLANMDANAGNQYRFGVQQRVVLASPHAVRPEDLNGDRERQAMANDANALGHDGGGDRRQGGAFGLRDRGESPGRVVDNQNRQMVSESARVAQQLKIAIEGANTMLETMHKPGNMIDRELVVDMELHLTNSVRFLAQQIEYQNDTIDQLAQTRNTLENEVERMAEDRVQLVKQLTREREARPGLSDVELRQLKLWGINDIHELINKFRLLQVAESSLSRSCSKLFSTHANYLFRATT